MVSQPAVRPGSSAPAERPLVLATRNAHKVVELRQILESTLTRRGLHLVGLDDFPQVGEVAETGVTFAENALIKARHVAQATGLPALADDSGLAVDVLGGAPGVFSARWAGPLADALDLDKDSANNSLLLAQLADVPDEHRAAGFVCAAALVIPGAKPVEVVREGRCRGVLARHPRGEGGFGYDPLLVRPDGRTLAEHSAAEKNSISHRGEAFRSLATELDRLFSSA